MIVKLLCAINVMAIMVIVLASMGTDAAFSLPDGALLPRRTQAMSYNKSVQRCEEAGMKPYMPKTRKAWDGMAQALFEKNLRQHEIWVPATDLITEEILVWEDGEDLDVDNIKWYQDKEMKYNRHDIDCLAMGSGPVPNAVMLPCHVKCMPFICVP